MGLKVKLNVYIIQPVYIPVFVHVGSHLGRDKTIQKISSRFFWKSINEYNTATSNAKFSKSNAKLHPIVPMPNVRHQVGDFVCRYHIHACTCTPWQDRRGKTAVRFSLGIEWKDYFIYSH